MPVVPRSDPPVFSIDLYPPRSLTRRGARRVVLFCAGVSGCGGFAFWLAGAWPVIGFLGIDVVLLWLAFHFSFRAARACEHIELHADTLRVTRISARGTRQEFDFQSYWLRVDLHHADDESCALFLRSHGRQMEIGRFLGAVEKTALAHDLDRVLYQARHARPLR